MIYRYQSSGKSDSAVFLTAAQQSEIRSREAKNAYLKANKIVTALSRKKKCKSKKVIPMGLIFFLLINALKF